jgi:predicted DNA-binding transcriptional regulator AlpA
MASRTNSADDEPQRFVDELLTLEEVAAMLKLPPATLRKWRAERRPPQAFGVGKWLRYRRSVVEAFLADQEAKERG